MIARPASLLFSGFPAGLLHLILIPVFLFFSLPLPDLHSAQVTLEWDPDASPGIAGYKIYYGNASRGYTTAIDVGNVSSCTVSNLQDSLDYYFAATAYDNSGQESGYSNEVTYNSCEVNLSSPGMVFKDTSGGTGTVSVTASSDCPWTAVSNASWIILTSNASASGSGTVNFTLSPATSWSARSGTITIGSKRFKVTQGLKRYFSTESR